MLSVGRQEKKQARSVEALLMGWAVRLAPHIHMDEYKRGRLKNTLAAAGLNMTPEEYTAFAMVKTGAVLLAVIPMPADLPAAGAGSRSSGGSGLFQGDSPGGGKALCQKGRDRVGTAPICGHHHTGTGHQPGCAEHG